METCLEHLKKYDGAISDLVEGNEKLPNRVDKRAKEIESLKSRILELETRNVLLSYSRSRMHGELRETQTTPVPGGKGKGMKREVVVFSDVEELDGPPSPNTSSSRQKPPR